MLDSALAIHKLYGMAKTDKKAMLTVRMLDSVYIELSAAAAQHGLTVSALVHQYAFKVIREEKERDPADFARAVLQAREEIVRNKAEKKAQKAKKKAAQTDKQDKRVVVNKRRQDRQQTDDAPNLTISPGINRPDTNEDTHEYSTDPPQPSPSLEKKPIARKEDMKPPKTPDQPPTDDFTLTSPHKMRRPSISGKGKNDPESAAVKRDVAKAVEKARAEEIEEEEKE